MALVDHARSRRRRRASRRGLHLESLEQRHMLFAASNVTAQVVGSTLLLTGDANDNQVIVASVAGGRMAVLGNLTTVNGSVNPFITSSAVTNIIANLNGGNDKIGFGNSAQGFADQLDVLAIVVVPPLDPTAIANLQNAIDIVSEGATVFSLPGSLTATTAAGDDVVALIGNVGGSVVVNLGSALTGSTNRNSFMIGGFDAAYASRVGGGLSVMGGEQNDVVELARTTVVGAVTVGLGNGSNAMNAPTVVRVGSLSYAGGSGVDFIDTADLTVFHGVSVSTGAGSDFVYLLARGGGLIDVGGIVVVNTGTDSDVMWIHDGTARGAVFAAMGDGDDVVLMENSTIGLGVVIEAGQGTDALELRGSTLKAGLSAATGAGDDSVGIYSTTVALNAVIDTGAGDDRVRTQDLRVGYSLFVYLGLGDDDLQVDTTRAYAAYLYGGPGTNTLAVDSASRSGIRRLYTYQFKRTAG